MEIIGIMLKSGILIDLTTAKASDVVVREMKEVNYRGHQTTDGIKWIEEPYKTSETYLRFISDEEVWEIKESEVAGFKFRKEADASYSKHIKMV